MTSTANTKIAVLQQEMKDFKNQYIQNSADNVKAHDNLLAGQNKIEKMLHDWMQGADRKYASKTVEKVVYGTLGAIALWFLNSVFKVIEIQ